MNGLIHNDPHSSEFVEVDPTGRYGRYNEVLGKGSSKTVYRAFDEYEGIEVAWNQIKLNDFLQRPEDLERLYCEIHLLKTLKHESIMKFYTSWVDTSRRNINFITELFSSGTLRQYILRHKRVNVRAVKQWSRQVLKGLHYLHSHDPPVIHRDLKCDNIFINGNQGEVKIGDLGLAAILRKSYADHVVGTPEFMAPEVYNEEYNELVDIYSFGMCILELVTLEYPYSECTTPAQIYKKVISGAKPNAFYKLKDSEVRNFVKKCLATVSLRLSALELLQDPFLEMDECQSYLGLMECQLSLDGFGTLTVNRCSNGGDSEEENGLVHTADVMEGSGIELFEYEEDESHHTVNISIKGKQHADGRVFLRLRIVDNEEQIRSIYFPFDIENDTALSVAVEMVAQLDISDQDEISIAQMIDGEVASLIPEWKRATSMEDDPCFEDLGGCPYCVSDHKSSGNLMASMSHVSVCTCTTSTTHGRFEEVTYRLEDGTEHEVMDDAPSVEFSSSGRKENHSDDEHGKFSQNTKDMREVRVENKAASDIMISFEFTKELVCDSQEDNGNGRIGTCSAPSFHDTEADEQSYGHRNFPKIGKLELESLNYYKQKNVRSKGMRTRFLFPACFPRTRSVLVDDIDVWTLYYETLHQSF